MFNKVVTRVRLDNLGPLDYLEWSNVGSINLIIGRNGTGKTLLLKAIYASLKSLERFKRGAEPDTLEAVLSDQLRRTFQGDKLGDLVRKGEKDGLRVAVDLGEERLSFQIAAKSDALKSVSLVADRNVYQEDSIFIPAKEILTLGRLIRETRERDYPIWYGFDGRYCDLAQYLQPALFEECPREMKKICADLKKIAGGQAKMCVNSHSWYFFDKNGCRYPLELVGEGTKKLALLRWLLLTRALNSGSVLLLDEPEAGICPSDVSRLWDIFYRLAEYGIQIFVATHSYFTIKKAQLLARKHGLNIPMLSLNNDRSVSSVPFKIDDLKDGTPTNEIIDESIRLYNEEIDLVFGDDAETI